LKIQKHDFLRFLELLHTFSRTLCGSTKTYRFATMQTLQTDDKQTTQSAKDAT